MHSLLIPGNIGAVQVVVPTTMPCVFKICLAIWLGEAWGWRSAREEGRAFLLFTTLTILLARASS